MDEVQEGIPKPVEEKKPENQKPKLTKEISQRVADVLENTMMSFEMAAYMVTKDELNLVLEELEDRRSKALSIGPLFNPSGWESKVMFFDQGIMKIKALIMLYEANELLKEQRKKEVSENRGAQVMAQILGLG